MKNKNLPVDNNWMTPKGFYDKLNEEFCFDHDPCPYYVGEITPENDGLNPKNEWGYCNFVNPPYEQKVKEAFVKRGIIEMARHKTSVFLLPVSTSTKLFHDFILPNAADIRFIKGRIKFQKIDEFDNIYTPSGGQHDSMVVVFKPKNNL